MTNERRRDKESSAGGHRKRTKFRVKRPRWSIGDVSTALAEVAKVPGPRPSQPFSVFGMSSRFEPDEADTDQCRSLLIDPDAYDASEQQFSASLEGMSSLPRFVVNQEDSISREAQSAPGQELSETVTEQTAKTTEIFKGESQQVDAASDGEETEASAEEMSVAPLQPDLLGGEGSSSWRDEVAARLNNYRARRTPRGRSKGPPPRSRRRP